MISLNKIFYGLFILMLVAGIYTYQLMWFKSSDELITLLLALLCVLDILSNKNHRRYKGLFWIVGIMTFYLLYSLVGVHYNTPKAIFYDFFIQIKPFIAFYKFITFTPELQAYSPEIGPAAQFKKVKTFFEKTMRCSQCGDVGNNTCRLRRGFLLSCSVLWPYQYGFIFDILLLLLPGYEP